MTFRAVPGGSVRQPGRMINTGGFNPSSLFAAGEQGVWYDPSDFSTLFQDSAGTTPVTATGQPVGKILDKSGRGNHATQATAASRPLLQQDGSGFYYLDFDGSDDFLVTASVNFTATDKMTVGLGIRKGTDAGTAIVLELSANGDTTPGAFYIAAPAAGANYLFTTLGTVNFPRRTASTFTAPITNTLSCQYDLAAATVALAVIPRVNGTTPSLANAGTAPATGSYVNAPIYLGRRGGISNPFTGRVYGVIVRGALSNAAQVASTEAFMNSKTGAY